MKKNSDKDSKIAAKKAVIFFTTETINPPSSITEISTTSKLPLAVIISIYVFPSTTPFISLSDSIFAIFSLFEAIYVTSNGNA